LPTLWAAMATGALRGDRLSMRILQ